MKCLWLGLRLFLCTLSPCDGYRRVERKGELYLREKERSGWKTARRCFRATNQQLWPQCASIISRAMMRILSFYKKKVQALQGRLAGRWAAKSCSMSGALTKVNVALLFSHILTDLCPVVGWHLNGQHEPDCHCLFLLITLFFFK